MWQSRRKGKQRREAKLKTSKKMQQTGEQINEIEALEKSYASKKRFEKAACMQRSEQSDCWQEQTQVGEEVQETRGKKRI